MQVVGLEVDLLTWIRSKKYEAFAIGSVLTLQASP